MGVVACYTGLLLWYLFLKLDSDVYPIKTYSDISRRIFGTWFANICTFLESLQLLVFVGTLVLSNGQNLSQISKGHVSVNIDNRHFIYSLATPRSASPFVSSSGPSLG
jgi:hypothetical protein